MAADEVGAGRPAVINRLYVSGPMSGYENFNYDVFRLVGQRLQAAGFEVVNPAEYSNPEDTYVDLLKEDIRRILGVDGIATLENWWESVGARTEVQIGGLLKLPVRPWEEWLRRAPNRRVLSHPCTHDNPCDECVAGHA